MARKTPEQKIAELKKKEAEVKAQQKKKLDQIKAQLQNENAKIATAARKKDTRRKVIAGALALKHMEHDPAFAETMRKLIQDNVERPEDQELLREL